MRREWIEIGIMPIAIIPKACLPPCGGSGLKLITIIHYILIATSPSMRREWIEMDDLGDYDYVGESPSMRREWIEM